MCRTEVVSGVALGALLALGVSPAAASIKHYRSDGWALKVRHDRFSGQMHCALISTNRHQRYQPGAIGFLVGKRKDTLAAWYRVDDGAPVRWQDRTATLIAANVAIDGPGLDNPTGGWVWVPIEELDGASLLAIRAGETGRVHRFRLRGFASMLAAANRLGCASDANFQS